MSEQFYTYSTYHRRIKLFESLAMLLVHVNTMLTHSAECSLQTLS